MNKYIQSIFLKRRTLSLKEQAYIASRLSFLIGAEVSLLQALVMLRAQSKKKKEQHIFDTLIGDISRGVFLGTSLSRITPRFSALAVHVITTGEITGTLGASLKHVAEELKKRHVLITKIISALVYPACIGIATMGVSAMIILYILPKIIPVFSSLKATLPLSTQILLGIHYTLSHYALFIFLAFGVVFVVSLFIWKKYRGVRIWLVRITLSVPLCGTIIKRYEIAQTFRTLGTLLRNNISLDVALINVSRGCVAALYEDEYRRIAHEVTRGVRMSSMLSQRPHLFPAMVSDMVGVGESSGNSMEVSLYISEYFERELDEVIKNMSSVLEPILMVIMGLIVGFVAIAVITPIYEITQNIKK